MLGLAIDGLSDELRDRIIVADNWQAGALLHADGSRCLLGHIGNAVLCDSATAIATNGYILNPRVELHWPRWMRTKDSWAFRFDKLCARFALQRIVTACKQRAAKRNNAAMAYWLNDGETPMEHKPAAPMTITAAAEGFTQMLLASAERHKEMHESLKRLAGGSS